MVWNACLEGGGRLTCLKDSHSVPHSLCFFVYSAEEPLLELVPALFVKIANLIDEHNL